MPICHERKLIFIHPSKCAGKSIEHAVFGFDKMSKSSHESVMDFDEHLLNEYLVFSVVRNPWDRYVSALFYFGYDPKHIKHHLMVDLGMCPNNPVIRVTPPIARQGDVSKGMLPYQELFCNTDGHMQIDKVLRFEQLQEDWQEMSDITGVETLPVINKGKPRSHFSTYFDNESSALLEKLYGWDIKQFRYSL